MPEEVALQSDQNQYLMIKLIVKLKQKWHKYQLLLKQYITSYLIYIIFSSYDYDLENKLSFP